jgi:hypothetical protein
MISLQIAAKNFELYVLDESEHVSRCTNPLEWIDWMKTTPRVVEANLLLNNREIVTLFAGYAGERRAGEPLVYCSIAKPEPQLPEFAVVLRWYATRSESEAGHADIVGRFSKANNGPAVPL